MPTFIGKPVTVAEDKQLQVGDILRDFNLTATDLSQKHFQNSTVRKKLSLSFHPLIQVSVQLKHVPLTRNCQN